MPRKTCPFKRDSLDRIRAVLLFMAASWVFFSSAHGQSAGKLSGRVLDSDGAPLFGANVMIVGTQMGAASDQDGYYVVLNIRPGLYSIRYSFIGYQTKLMENVRITSDLTKKIDVVLAPEAIAGQTIVITAKKPLVEFNQTSSVMTVAKEDIARLPVQDLNQIVSLKAGVVEGHFRGGRLGEVQYQVDGVTVNNSFNNASMLQLDRSVLEEVQVISGTFDAKYGQAMSGVVNAVLKTGSNTFEWSGEAYGGDCITADKSRYPHNQSFNPFSLQNVQITLSGPALVPKTTFFLSGRYFSNEGFLFGRRRFMPTEKNDFENGIYTPTGDNALVSMGDGTEWSGQFKLTNELLKGIQVSYQAIVSQAARQAYSHDFRFNPDGQKTNHTLSITHGFHWTQTLSRKMFYTISLRQNYFDYTDCMYEDVFDPRYLEAGQSQGEANYEYGASVQGVDIGRYMQRTSALIGKGDWTWQAARNHFLENGVEFQVSKISFGSPGFLKQTMISGTQTLQPHLGTQPEDPKVETYTPWQFSAYMQDRVEWGDFVIRAGMRLEYFDAKADVPGDLQNPANAIAGSPTSLLRKATVKSSLAPRVGFSFPLSSSASVYFSYGHFYQLPGLGDLYNNSNYLVLDELQAGGISYGVMGNPDLKPEQTVQYEFGLKQALTSFLGLEWSLFYKDIRDLLGVEFVSTYTAAEYPRFTNIDFGNVYGMTVSLDQRMLGPVSTTLDYTMQFSQGNSSDPRETANRAAEGKDARPREVPFGWDQRHTINATAVVMEPNNYSASAILRFGSGQPYTPEIGSGFGADLEINSGRKSSFVIVDLRLEKVFSLAFAQASVFLRGFNVLNQHFANGFVFATTGSPDYSLYPAANQSQLINPARFYEPRRIEIGLSLRSKTR